MSQYNLTIENPTTYTLQVVDGAIGLPPGGTTGQALVKTSNADYAATWQTIVGGGGGGSLIVSAADGNPSAAVSQIVFPNGSVSIASGVATITGLTGPQGPAGPTGPQGATGATGPQGATGATGPQGPQGNTGATGPVGPTGPAGATGATGAAGADGKTVRSGTGAPSAGLGVNGDFYIDTNDYFIYGPKTAGGWGSPIDLVGAQGPQGPTGPQGPAGATGATGPQGPAGQGVPVGGTTNQVLAKSSNADYATQWVTPAGGGSGAAPQLTYYAISNAYLTRRGTGASTAVLTANRRFYQLIYIAETRTINEIAVTVTTAAASSSIRLGIRNCNQATGQPTTLIVDAGTVDSSTTGLKSITGLNQTLSPGWYVLEITSNGTPTVGAYSAPEASFGTEVSAAGVNPIPTLFRDVTFGALASDETSNTMARSSTGVIVGIR